MISGPHFNAFENLIPCLSKTMNLKLFDHSHTFDVVENKLVCGLYKNPVFNFSATCLQIKQ